VDWRVFKAIYSLSLHHHWLGSLFHGIEQASIPFMVLATAALWFLARPGGDRKWKLAAASGFLSAALAFVANFVIHAIWDRPRPYETHAISHPWSTSTDASFPSDHASLSLAIAFAVLAFDSAAGAVLVVAAVIIAIGRVFIGAHYPGDILASLTVATAVTIIVIGFARPLVAAAVRLVERVSDPLVRPLWRRG
jgi:undecaprenyl-diphosphatase